MKRLFEEVLRKLPLEGPFSFEVYPSVYQNKYHIIVITNDLSIRSQFVWKYLSKYFSPNDLDFIKSILIEPPLFYGADLRGVSFIGSNVKTNRVFKSLLSGAVFFENTVTLDYSDLSPEKKDLLADFLESIGKPYEANALRK